jgi:hypothetical protein
MAPLHRFKMRSMGSPTHHNHDDVVEVTALSHGVKCTRAYCRCVSEFGAKLAGEMVFVCIFDGP